MKQETITYHYRGHIERGNGRSYAWRDGYSEAGEGGGVMYPWSTKSECQQEAKAKGCRAKFVRSTT